MSVAKRRRRGAKPAVLPLALPVLRWLTNADALLRFERTYAGRLTTYADKVGNLIQARSTDPGQWIEEYTDFVSRVIEDAGDLMLQRDSSGAIPYYRAKMYRAEGAASIDLTIPPVAFASRPGRAVKLVTEDLRARGGGASIPVSNIAIVRSSVRRSNRHAKFKIFGLKDAVVQGSVYRGTVWTEPEQRVVAVIEVQVM